MNTKLKIASALVQAVDIPPSYYQKAHSRYEDLGKWFGRDGSRTGHFAPRVYGQGSFRLGTVIRPFSDNGSYDLDVGCRLESGVSKSLHTQKQLKELIGGELEAYRKFRQIENPLEEKHRCWCLEYSDELPFHMDVVPSIPEEATKRASLALAMESSGMDGGLSASVAYHSGNITDKRQPNYAKVDPDWRISNSEGYALWFESRMSVSKILMEKVAVMASRAKVEKLPSWEWKSPLQQAIQLLKRHRDVMFRSAPDSAPISIIITTLAAKSYQGESDLGAVLEAILGGMDSHIRPATPRIPNPVNPNEDFSDKWSNAKYKSLDLEGNFRRWLVQARTDFNQFDKLSSREALEKFLWEKFRVRLTSDNLDELARLLPGAGLYSGVQIITEQPARPWADGCES